MRSHLVLLTIVLLAVQGCGPSAGGAQVPTLPDPTSAGGMVAPEPTVPEPSSDGGASVPGPSVLPAPLYFLGEDEQIWRVEVDATTLAPVTAEPDAVVEFDVSPLDGSLVYITGNTLVRTDSMGGGRAVLVAGSSAPAEPDEQWYGAVFSDPVWSPDGRQIAYGSNGVNVYSLDSNASTVLLPSDPFPTDFSDAPELIQFYRPAEWSPDGTRLLVSVSYFPEGGTLRVVDLSDGSQVGITNPDGYVCCYETWSRDGLNVFFANDMVGMYESGLWRADVVGGMGVTLIAGEENGLYSLVAYPYQANDGQLYTFMAITQAFPEGYIPLAMTRSAPDGVTGRATLRSDSYILADVLWDPDGRGALIGDMSAQIMSVGYPAQASNPFLWLPSDDSPAVTLPAMGSMPQWGK